MSRTDSVSVLQQTCDALRHDAERLRMAHVWGQEYNWRPAEDEATLSAAAEKVERFRLNLLRFARERVKN
jgi:hypothetical protein